jgi:regulatory protein
VDRQIIDEKLNQLSDEDEKKRAFQLGEKKLKTLKEEDPLKRKIKLYNFLIGKGYEYEIVKIVVSKLIKDEYEYGC